MIRTDGKPTIASPPIERVKRDAKTARQRTRECPHCGRRVARGKVCGCYLRADASAAVAAVVAPRPHPVEAAALVADWTAIGLRLNPEELAVLDAFRYKGIAPLSRAESARALIRRALGLGRGSR